MNGDRESQHRGNYDNNNRIAAEDDYEDNGSGIEDDAPESFRAMVAPDPPLETFPDLLRVPTNTTNNSATEDDSPESLLFAAAQPFRPNSSTSSYRSVTANSMDQSSSNVALSRGGIPRNSLSLVRPDVSQVEQSNCHNASSRIFPNSNPSSRPGSSSSLEPSGSSSLSNSRPLPPLPTNSTFEQSSRYQFGSAASNNTNRIAHHPHRSPINSLNLSSALCASSLDSYSHSSSSLSSTLSLSLAPISEALARAQSSIDALSRHVNERLDTLESRLNNLTSSNLIPSPSPNLIDNCAANLNDPEANIQRISSESLKNFIEAQRKEMQNERRAFLLSFAEALKYAAGPANGSEPSVSGLNGPKL